MDNYLPGLVLNYMRLFLCVCVCVCIIRIPWNLPLLQFELLIYALGNLSVLLLTSGFCISVSTRAKKYFLVLTCGPPSLSSALPKAKGEDAESCSDDSDSDEENQSVSWPGGHALHICDILFLWKNKDL